MSGQKQETPATLDMLRYSWQQYAGITDFGAAKSVESLTWKRLATQARKQFMDAAIDGHVSYGRNTLSAISRGSSTEDNTTTNH